MYFRQCLVSLLLPVTAASACFGQTAVSPVGPSAVGRLPSTLNSTLLSPEIAGVGDKDIGLTDNHTMLAEMKKHGIEVTAYESPGFHAWNIWRDHLNRFAPLLFNSPNAKSPVR